MSSSMKPSASCGFTVAEQHHPAAMRQRLAQGLSAVAIALALVACGGDESPAPAEPGSGVPANQRIETLDTAGLKQRAAAHATQDVMSRMPASAPVERIALPPLSAPLQAKAQADNIAGKPADTPMRIGVARKTTQVAQAAALARQLHWQPLADGAQVAALDFWVDDAQGLRLGLDVQQLPEGAELRFFDADGTAAAAVSSAEIANVQALNAEAGVDAAAARLYWAPITHGAGMRLELQIPAEASAEQVRLAVPLLSQLMRIWDEEAPAKANTGLGASDSCNIDAVCAPDWDVQSRAVARMLYTDADGSSFLCSGTLLNDTQDSQTPYFLTARHCIATQLEASSLQTRWFFRRARCGGAALDDRTVDLGGGAVLLFEHEPTDTTLLRLRGDVPDDVVYAGSYFGPNVPMGGSRSQPQQRVVGLHHPAGDAQKFSRGSILGYGRCIDDRCGVTDASGDLLVVRWLEGITEQGSSGSALLAPIDGKPYIVGALYAGSASCSRPSGIDVYGRFELAFAAGLGDWLTGAANP